MPAWTRRREKDLTYTFRSFGTGWLSRSRRAEPGLLDLGRSGCAAAMASAVSVDQGVQQRADIHKKSQPERDGHRKGALRYPYWPSPSSGCAGQVEIEPVGNSALDLGEHGPGQADLKALPESDQGRNRRKPYSCQRDDRGHGIQLPVDRADVGSGEDRTSDKEVVNHLQAAADLRVIPGPGVAVSTPTGPTVLRPPDVVEGGDQERRVIFGGLLAGRVADSDPRMLA
jgi:hypothetical protein